MYDKTLIPDKLPLMTNAQAIDALVELYREYERRCGTDRLPEKYKNALLKAVAAIGFADGFVRACEEAKNGGIRL